MIEQLLTKYGYFILFFGIAVEGEASLLGASFLAHRGYFDLRFVIGIAIVANCLADQIYFQIARTRGRAWLDSRFGRLTSYRKLVHIVERHSVLVLLASRFAFGFRILIPAACGALGMPAWRFSVVNLTAAVIWAVPTALAGFYFGHAAQSFLARVKHIELLIVVGFVFLAIAILLIRHFRRAEWIEDLNWADLHYLAPLMIGFMGFINLTSAIWPHSHLTFGRINGWLPFGVAQHSRPLMLMAGIALLQVTRNLARRKELAWYVAVIALSVSLLLHITRGLDLHHSLVAGLLLLYLFYFRKRFYARSDPVSLRLGLEMALLLETLVMVYGMVGLYHLDSQFRWPHGFRPAIEAFRCGILIREPDLEPLTRHAAQFLSSLQVSGWLARLYLLVLLLRPVILRSRMECPPDLVQRTFLAHGRFSLSAFAIQADKHHLQVAEGTALVGYAVRGSVALACGDPLAAPDRLKQALQEYLEFCHRNGWTPCVYEGAQEHLSLYEQLGLRTLKIAEEALINLKEFSLAGNKRANLRAMVNKVSKTGMVIERYDRAVTRHPQKDEQLESISEEWLSEKRLGEMSFTLGRFSLEALENKPLFLAREGDRIVAFCSWLPYRSGHAAVLDLMRKRRNAAAGTMDLLLALSLQHLKTDGLEQASLGNAPLANVGEPHTTLDRGVSLLFENLNSFYGYKNLFQFKKKFAPRWEGRYLVYPQGANLPKIAYALTRLHTEGGLWHLLWRR